MAERTMMMVADRFPESYELFERYFRHVYKERWAHVEAHDMTHRRYINSLSITDQLVCDIKSLVSQTENGSLSQWLCNSDGDRFDITVDSLQKIGAFHARDVLLELKEFFPGKQVPFSQEERQAVIYPRYYSGLQGRFDELSEQLLERCEDLFGLSISYLSELGYDEKTFFGTDSGCW